MKFKTSMKCDNCIKTVKPQLDSIKEISQWSVDLSTHEGLLTVEGDVEAEKIVEALKAVGYTAQKI